MFTVDSSTRFNADSMGLHTSQTHMHEDSLFDAVYYEKPRTNANLKVRNLPLSSWCPLNYPTGKDILISVFVFLESGMEWDDAQFSPRKEEEAVRFGFGVVELCCPCPL